jgi:hypothetical protein
MLFAIEGRVGQKKLWGIVGLARSYPRRLIDSACARAITDGVHSYRHVKAITEKLVADALAAIETSPVQAELALTQEHALIRSAQVYADLFAQCAATESPQSTDSSNYRSSHDFE